MATVSSTPMQMPPPAVINQQANSEVPLSDKEALVYDGIVSQYAKIVRFGWWELGDAAKIIKQRNLWKQFSAPQGEEPFHSFEDYINRRAQKSRAAMYRSLQLRDGLAEIPENDCRNMSQANAIWMLRLVKRIAKKKALDPKVVANALSMQEKEFAEYCNALLPGAAKEEKKENITFTSCDRSLAKVVDRALQVAMWDGELDDRRDALEKIVSHYLMSSCEHEGFKNLSNEQAYAKAHGRKRTNRKVN